MFREILRQNERSKLGHTKITYSFGKNVIKLSKLFIYILTIYIESNEVLLKYIFNQQ